MALSPSINLQGSSLTEEEPRFGGVNLYIVSKILAFFRRSENVEVAQSPASEPQLWKYNTLDDLKAAKISQCNKGLSVRYGTDLRIPSVRERKEQSRTVSKFIKS